MERLINAIKAHAGSMDASRGQPRFGTVQSVDPKAATVRVTLQPEGVLSGWLPLLTPWAGAGWGVFAPPLPGDQVLVVPHEGDADHGVVIGCIYSADVAPPPDVTAGEIWIVHKSGTSLSLRQDGTVQIKGDLHVSGDVFDGHGALAQLRAHYNAHTHPNGGTPSPQD